MIFQEEIFADYSCTLRTQSTQGEKNNFTNVMGSKIGGLIDHRGRMYLTKHYLCFRSNVIGIKTKFVSKFHILKVNINSMWFHLLTENKIY